MCLVLFASKTENTKNLKAIKQKLYRNCKKVRTEVWMQILKKERERGTEPLAFEIALRSGRFEARFTISSLPSSACRNWRRWAI